MQLPIFTKPQHSFLHLLGLRRAFVEPRLEIGTAMLPSLIDSRPHIFSQDDELLGPAVV
jgi:hypothetical protein